MGPRTRCIPCNHEARQGNIRVLGKVAALIALNSRRCFGTSHRATVAQFTLCLKYIGISTSTRVLSRMSSISNRVSKSERERQRERERERERERVRVRERERE